MYTHAWYHWITFFYIYCFFGWIFESTYVSLKKRKYINRGFLRLPLLPLYGTGAVMMLWLSLPVQDNLFLLYCSGVMGATVLEYITGYVMERLFKVRYWDYSNVRWNLHGYVCLSSSLAWGFLTILMTRVLHQPVERFVLNMPAVVEFSLIGVISCIFMFDCIQSVRAALDLARALESITAVKAELEELHVQLALLKAETGQYLEEHKKMSQLKVAAYKTASKQKTALFKSALRQKLTVQLQELTEKRHSLLGHINFYRKGILRGNPSATSRRFAEALKELRETIDHYK
ncbi:MAG: putative ABC transporter permease [Lachnospiraceae bacterium]